MSFLLPNLPPATMRCILEGKKTVGRYPVLSQTGEERIAFQADDGDWGWHCSNLYSDDPKWWDEFIIPPCKKGDVMQLQTDSKLQLPFRITALGVERLQDIRPADAVKEGFVGDAKKPGAICTSAVYRFIEYWDKLMRANDYYPQYRWIENPWVWVITFEQCSIINTLQQQEG